MLDLRFGAMVISLFCRVVALLTTYYVSHSPIQPIQTGHFSILEPRMPLRGRKREGKYWSNGIWHIDLILLTPFSYKNPTLIVFLSLLRRSTNQLRVHNESCYANIICSKQTNHKTIESTATECDWASTSQPKTVAHKFTLNSIQALDLHFNGLSACVSRRQFSLSISTSLRRTFNDLFITQAFGRCRHTNTLRSFMPFITIYWRIEWPKWQSDNQLYDQLKCKLTKFSLNFLFVWPTFMLWTKARIKF